MIGYAWIDDRCFPPSSSENIISNHLLIAPGSLKRDLGTDSWRLRKNVLRRSRVRCIARHVLPLLDQILMAPEAQTANSRTCICSPCLPSPASNQGSVQADSCDLVPRGCEGALCWPLIVLSRQDQLPGSEDAILPAISPLLLTWLGFNAPSSLVACSLAA